MSKDRFKNVQNCRRPPGDGATLIVGTGGWRGQGRWWYVISPGLEKINLTILACDGACNNIHHEIRRIHVLWELIAKVFEVGLRDLVSRER